MSSFAMLESYKRIREEVPDYVTIIAAAKTRTTDDINKAIDAGVTDIGENYVQEAEHARTALGDSAQNLRWHMIGHLQTNKINRAIPLFDMIQTVDSLKLARAVNSRAEANVPILLEVNSGREHQKTGFLPEEAERNIREIALLEKISVEGLMTMGPRFGDPDDARPYFRNTKRLFDHLVSLNIPNIELRILSMGMSNTYEVAIEEGSTMIRLGTILFERREA